MVDPGWYRSYFAEPYGEIYADYLLPPRITEDEADFAFDVLGLDEATRVLDCPCGFGRHMALFDRGRANVVGVDLEPTALRRGKRFLPAGRFARADMRSLPFLGHTFAAVTNLFNSFGYFGPRGDQAVLREFGRVLEPGGRLLIDVSNYGPLVEAVRDSQRTRQVVHDLVLTEEWDFDPASKTLTNRGAIALAGTVTHRSFRVRIYSLAELEPMLATAGLHIEAVYGDFDRSPYEIDQSDRLIVMSKRH